MKRVCVFCGSAFGRKPEYKAAAIAMGQVLARNNLSLVYGGGHVGLMGVVADAVLAEGGEVFGVIPRFLDARELAHSGLTGLHIVDSMHERKALMAKLSDGFIAMPGGFGTFEEFFEILTWAQLGLHRKPLALLNVEGYYNPLLKMFDQVITEEFAKPTHRGIILESSDPQALLEKMKNYQPPHTPKWVDEVEQT